MDNEQRYYHIDTAKNMLSIMFVLAIISFIITVYIKIAENPTQQGIDNEFVTREVPQSLIDYHGGYPDNYYYIHGRWVYVGEKRIFFAETEGYKESLK